MLLLLVMMVIMPSILKMFFIFKVIYKYEPVKPPNHYFEVGKYYLLHAFIDEDTEMDKLHGFLWFGECALCSYHKHPKHFSSVTELCCRTYFYFPFFLVYRFT